MSDDISRERGMKSIDHLLGGDGKTIGHNIQTPDASPDTSRMGAVEIVVGMAARLKAAERGENEYGPYWNTKELVEALRWWYSVMPNSDVTPYRG